jgi:hypothetical protein
VVGHMRSNALGPFWEVYFGVAVFSGPPRQVLGKPVIPFRGRALPGFPLQCRSLMQSLELRRMGPLSCGLLASSSTHARQQALG